MLEPGQQVGNYTIGPTLGQGGFATVYEAQHMLLHSRHAIKVLAPELLATEELRARFLTEGRILAQLRHPNIVRVTDVVVEPGVAGLVMDHVQGLTLTQELERCQGGAPLKQTLRWFRPLLGAVETAHRRGIVHRDLKPDNILLTRNQNGRVKPVVLDFGIAKILDDESITRLATRQGTTMGTPGYMSPEQIKNSKTIDHRTDIFALGVILFEALTGSAPFRGNSEFEVMRATVDREYDLERLPEPFQALIASMLSDKDHRVTSCMDVHDRLMQLVEQTPTSAAAAPITSRAPASRPAPPHVPVSPPKSTPKAAATPLPTSTAPAQAAKPVAHPPAMQEPAFDRSACIAWAHRRSALTTFIEAVAWKSRAKAHLRAADAFMHGTLRELAVHERAFEQAKEEWAQQPFYMRAITSPKDARALRAQVQSIHNLQTACRDAKAHLLSELDCVVVSKSDAKDQLKDLLLDRQRLGLKKTDVSAAMRNVRERASAATAKVGTGLTNALIGSPSARAFDRKTIRLNKEARLQALRGRRNEIEEDIRAIKKRELWLKSLK